MRRPSRQVIYKKTTCIRILYINVVHPYKISRLYGPCRTAKRPIGHVKRSYRRLLATRGGRKATIPRLFVPNQPPMVVMRRQFSGFSFPLGHYGRRCRSLGRAPRYSMDTERRRNVDAEYFSYAGATFDRRSVDEEYNTARCRTKKDPRAAFLLSGGPKNGGDLLSQLVCQYHRRG